jgi:ABC-type antimicrobial peptide transport system permease subunit
MMLQVKARSAVAAGEFLAAIREAVAATAPRLPVLAPVWMTSMTANATLAQRVASGVLGTAGVLALLLAALGLHGVVAYGVSQRIPEIGLRMALGADRRAVYTTVLGGALRLIVIGMVMGVAVAAAAGQVVSDLLVGVDPLDPLALSVAVVALGLAAALGCAGPVRRATRIDPVTALRAL